MAELLAANQITIAKVLDGADGEMSAEQLAQLNQASEDASQAKSDVANLEIGGRNLLTNPIYFLADGAVSNGITFNRTSNPSAWKIKGTATSTVNISLIGFTNTSTPTDSTILLKEGQTYTASIKIEGSWLDSAYLGVGISNSSGAYLSEFGLNSTTAKSYTFTAKAEQYTLRYWTVVIPSGGIVDCTVYCKFEIGDKATDWTPAPEDVDAGIANAQTGVDSLNDTVFGVQTFEYILDGVTIPVHKREDGTYYYILNDEEVTVAEANLVHDSDGNLVSYQDGGIYESLDNMSDNIEAIGTKVNSFDARETAIYNAIQDNSLIARKNARVEGNSLIITNDTATEAIANLLNYLQLNADSIVIYGNGKDIVTIAKTADDSGYMKMNGTSMLQAQESKFSTIRLRSADGTGNLALVAGSDGHVSLREVL